MSISVWWARKRLRYNFGLMAAGGIAFALYCTVFDLGLAYFPENVSPKFEITLFTTAFQAVGYLIMMGVANVCYYLGPVSERILKPKDAGLYRRVCFGLGFWLSFALPFAVPALLVAKFLL